MRPTADLQVELLRNLVAEEEVSGIWSRKKRYGTYKTVTTVLYMPCKTVTALDISLTADLQVERLGDLVAEEEVEVAVPL